MSFNEADMEALRAAVLRHRQTMEELQTSHRDFGLLLGPSVNTGAERPNQWLARLLSESTEEAERLFKSGTDAMEALARMGFKP